MRAEIFRRRGLLMWRSASGEPPRQFEDGIDTGSTARPFVLVEFRESA
jgi:hypothetical protein